MRKKTKLTVYRQNNKNITVAPVIPLFVARPHKEKTIWNAMVLMWRLNEDACHELAVAIAMWRNERDISWLALFFAVSTAKLSSLTENPGENVLFCPYLRSPGESWARSPWEYHFRSHPYNKRSYRDVTWSVFQPCGLDSVTCVTVTCRAPYQWKLPLLLTPRLMTQARNDVSNIAGVEEPFMARHLAPVSRITEITVVSQNTWCVVNFTSATFITR